MLFAKLRRSVALFICPELGPRPVRAGYDGSTKPMERAALDAALEAKSPEERGFFDRGFFDADEARAHSKARKEFIEAERERLNLLTNQGAKALVMRSCEVVKARYPVVQDVGQVAEAAVPEVPGHLANALDEEHLRGRVVAERQGSAEKPHLGQQGQSHFHGVNAGWDVAGLGHHSSPSVDVPCDASPSTGGCE